MNMYIWTIKLFASDIGLSLRRRKKGNREMSPFWWIHFIVECWESFGTVLYLEGRVVCTANSTSFHSYEYVCFSSEKLVGDEKGLVMEIFFVFVLFYLKLEFWRQKESRDRNQESGIAPWIRPLKLECSSLCAAFPKVWGLEKKFMAYCFRDYCCPTEPDMQCFSYCSCEIWASTRFPFCTAVFSSPGRLRLSFHF